MKSYSPTKINSCSSPSPTKSNSYSSPPHENDIGALTVEDVSKSEETPKINGTMYAAQCLLHSESEGEEDIYKILDYSRENDDSLMYSPTCPYKTSTL